MSRKRTYARTRQEKSLSRGSSSRSITFWSIAGDRKQEAGHFVVNPCAGL